MKLWCILLLETMDQQRGLPQRNKIIFNLLKCLPLTMSSLEVSGLFGVVDRFILFYQKMTFLFKTIPNPFEKPKETQWTVQKVCPPFAFFCVNDWMCDDQPSVFAFVCISYPGNAYAASFLDIYFLNDQCLFKCYFEKGSHFSKCPSLKNLPPRMPHFRLACFLDQAECDWLAAHRTHPFLSFFYTLMDGCGKERN